MEENSTDGTARAEIGLCSDGKQNLTVYPYDISGFLLAIKEMD